MSETTTKIRLRSILIHRAEGLKEECVERRVSSFEEAEAVIRQMARTAPDDGSCDKTDILVEFEDGKKFGFRFDMDRSHSFSVDLHGDARRHVEFYAGRWHPERMTQARYEAYLQNWPDEQKAAFAEFLDRYEWR